MMENKLEEMKQQQRKAIKDLYELHEKLIASNRSSIDRYDILSNNLYKLESAVELKIKTMTKRIKALREMCEDMEELYHELDDKVSRCELRIDEMG